MGFQTNISILNDHFDWIEKNPETFVKAIKYEMNDGTGSMVREHFARERARCRDDEYFDPNGHETDAGRQARIHYVTVHRACHADVPQVILSHRNSAWDIYDFTRGVELGVLDSKSNPDVYVSIGRDVAEELRRQAAALDRALDEHEKRAAASAPKQRSSAAFDGTEPTAPLGEPPRGPRNDDRGAGDAATHGKRGRS